MTNSMQDSDESYKQVKEEMEEKKHVSRRSRQSDVDKRIAAIREAKQVDLHPPYPKIRKLLTSQKMGRPVVGVLHWFRNADMRVNDNRALFEAASIAAKNECPLFCLYIYCAEDRHWLDCKPPRANFQRNQLIHLSRELEALNIPLIFKSAKLMSAITDTLMSVVDELEISHLYANYEYELERLNRDLHVLEAAKAKKLQVIYRHDQTIKEPLTIKSSNGKPMRVFTPYHAVWCAEVAKHPELLEVLPTPKGNPSSLKNVVEPYFKQSPSDLPKEQVIEDDKARARYEKLWPVGHKAAMHRLEEFIERHLPKYGETRSNASLETSSRMSPYFSAGIVSMREIGKRIAECNGGSTDFSANGSSAGIFAWMREIVFREVYKQRLLDIPHLALPVPENLKFVNVHWDEDEDGYKRWENGTLGVPLVDAGMRQINAEAWMHNRLRMNVASYLKCNLCIDYRRGERFFETLLMDYDLSSNAQGWEPSFTVFNPVLQAEKNDPDGDYIRRWIPELRNVKGKAIFDPYNRLDRKEFEKLGYPAPYKEFKGSKSRALDKFGAAMKVPLP